MFPRLLLLLHHSRISFREQIVRVKIGRSTSSLDGEEKKKKKKKEKEGRVSSFVRSFAARDVSS